MNMPTEKECSRRWVEGMLRTPPVPCPRCGKETRWENRCQSCKEQWTSGEWLERRKMQAASTLEICKDETLDEITRKNLKLFAETVLKTN